MGGLPCVGEDEHRGTRKGLAAWAEGGPSLRAVFQSANVLSEVDVEIGVRPKARCTEGGRVYPAAILKEPAAAGQRLAKALLRCRLFEEAHVALWVGVLEHQFPEVGLLLF